MKWERIEERVAQVGTWQVTYRLGILQLVRRGERVKLTESEARNLCGLLRALFGDAAA